VEPSITTDGSEKECERDTVSSELRGPEEKEGNVALIEAVVVVVAVVGIDDDDGGGDDTDRDNEEVDNVFGSGMYNNVGITAGTLGSPPLPPLPRGSGGLCGEEVRVDEVEVEEEAAACVVSRPN
jgi:hypothetical protein